MADFIGVPNAVHLHLKGNPYHFKFATDNGTRVDFGANDKAPYDRAKAAFNKLQNYKGKPGYDECMKYFKKIYGWS